MNAAHWHLLLNHIPILGTIFGLLLLAYALSGRKPEEGRASLTKASFGVFVVAGLAAVVVYLTGEGAEDIAEQVAGVSEAFIEPHEEVAVYALIAAIALGVFSLAGLVLSRRRKVPGWLSALVLMVALGTSGVMGYTAYLGGQINHPEIRSEQTAGSEEGQPRAFEEAEHE